MLESMNEKPFIEDSYSSSTRATFEIKFDSVKEKLKAHKELRKAKKNFKLKKL